MFGHFNPCHNKYGLIIYKFKLLLLLIEVTKQVKSCENMIVTPHEVETAA